jgi:hypothetical protein
MSTHTTTTVIRNRYNELMENLNKFRLSWLPNNVLYASSMLIQSAKNHQQSRRFGLIDVILWMDESLAFSQLYTQWC